MLSTLSKDPAAKRLASTVSKAAAKAAASSSASAAGAADASAPAVGGVATKASGSASFRTTKVIEANYDNKPSVVILGSGWGAISFLKHIDTKKYNVSIVSPRPYFLFTPLLPSTPVGTVDEKSIVEPVVNFALKKKGNVTYYETAAQQINPDRNTVSVSQVSDITQVLTSQQIRAHEGDTVPHLKPRDQIEIKYDYLVTAVGAEPNTFNIPGVQEHGLFMKEIDDSFKVRQKFAHNLEKANFLPPGDPERKRLLSIVVVGGGPTGVETAGELQDYVTQELKKYSPSLASEVQIHLVEAMPIVLNMFDKKLSSYAQSVLQDTSIKLHLKTAVAKVEADHLIAKTKHDDGSVTEENIPYGTLIWATGNKCRPVITDLFKKIPAQNASTRALNVNPFLQVKGSNNIFAIGDNAFVGLPPTAQVAHQEAEYLAKTFDKMAQVENFHSELAQRKEKVDLLFEEKHFKPFKYVHLGALAYLGAEKAIANITYGKYNLYTGGGALTFYIWRATYLSMLLSARTKFKVAMDWVKLAFFKRDFFKEM